MIRLFTGLPGSFKTCRATRVIREAIAKGRPVFATNVEGLNVPGVQTWEDPNDWQALPPGALLVVDEAQRYWRASRSPEVPAPILAMETHRHMGIDFLLTTQQPGYLLKHLRDLVGEHVHHIRNGKMRARTLTWNRCCVDLTSTIEAKKADVGFFLATKEDFESYTSTVKDTHKARINRRHILLGVAALAIITVFAAAGRGTLWGRDEFIADAAGEAVPPSPQARAGQASGQPISREKLLANLTPVVDAAPWSAPAYQEREVVAEPEIYCISSEAGTDANGRYKPGSQTCLTEQGTLYLLDPHKARILAKQGPMYNPYREPRQQQQQQQQQGEFAQVSAATPDAAQAKPEPMQQASYGSMRAKDYPAILTGDT